MGSLRSLHSDVTKQRREDDLDRMDLAYHVTPEGITVVLDGDDTGAAHLIESFGTGELVDAYIPKLYLGEWQGTMALTEPHAGSSLSDITTEAEPTDQDTTRFAGRRSSFPLAIMTAWKT
jgi:alkylation response protein AidB-like acyl-CoA dehydrogenase